jgi:cytochrome c553
MAQVLDRFGPPDWHPDGHPSMPVMVAAGQKPDIWACAFCHLPNGQGRPENAALAGLSSSYFLQSMHDYKTGARASSNPVVTAKMTEFAKAMTDEQIRQAADYFERLKYRSWVKVQESATAPAYRVSARMLVPLPGTREPLGQRIVEVPAAPDRVELRDDTSGFIAYVPVGSVKKGAALAKSIDPMACAGCHGAGLKGSAAAPPLAGRSPSQMLRQLYDFHTGARQGTNNVAMTAIVASLSLDEMISIAAYTASLAP